MIFSHLLVSFVALAQAEEGLRLYPGYLTRVQCEGRLLVSAIGNEQLVRLEALPRDLGCGVLLKPIGPAGRTNLILETSAGSIERIVEISAANRTLPSRSELTYRVQGGTP